MVVIVLLLTAVSDVFAATVDGFVTEVSSSNQFVVGSLQVTTNRHTQCETQELVSDIYLKERVHSFILAHRYFALKPHPSVLSKQPVRCNQLPIFVGSRIQAIGHRSTSSNAFVADSIFLYTIKFRQTFSTVWSDDNSQSAALLEESPNITKSGTGWAGTMWLDGYPAVVTSDTQTFKTGNEANISYQSFGMFSDARLGAKNIKSVGPIMSGSTWKTNTWAEYRGVKSPTGSVMLSHIVIWPNRVTAPETKLQLHYSRLANSLACSCCLNEDTGHKSEQALSGNSMIHDMNIQAFVAKIGQSLIPDYQKKLPATDPTKIKFRFCVVQSHAERLKDVMMPEDARRLPADPIAPNVITAFPDGQIFISDLTLANLRNVAQLGSLLSDSITSILQKHAYIARNARPSSGGNMDFINLSKFVMFLGLHEQSLRIGIRQMYLTGYDIREAPFAWAVAQGKPVSNPVIDSKDPEREIPWYAAYAFNYISQYYKDVDYSKLKRGEAEYAAFLKELRKADPEAFAGAESQADGVGRK